MMYSLSKRTAFRLLIQSKGFLEVRVHWFGRTLICPGIATCPACKCTRPKSYWYALATIDKKLECVEMCDSLARALRDFQATLERPVAAGIVAFGKRSKVRSTWTLEKLELHTELVKDVGDDYLIDSVSKLYQIPLGQPGMTIKEWFPTARAAHAPLLARCVIPM